MCHYNHLTLIEREKIMVFRSLGYSITNIGKKLNRSKSTISREIRRNYSEGTYQAAIAQKEYKERRLACRPHKRLDDPELLSFVKDKIFNHQWSPEQVDKRLVLERHHTVISYSTIYRGIQSGYFGDEELPVRAVLRKLRHHGKKRHKKGTEEHRGKIKISNDIKDRPSGAENRSRRGHWEADTVIGKAGKACLVTLVDRKTRFLLGGKAEAKTADAVNKVMIEALKNEPLKSITPDRGKEFSKHEDVTAELDKVKFYFPLPHQPWQRGTDENTNGLLREYFPKGQDITDVPAEYIQQVYDEINHRPRKCLGYKTPYEAYYSKTLHLT